MTRSNVRPILWYSNETPSRDGQGGQRRQYFQIAALLRDGLDVRVMTLAGDQDDTSLRAVVPVRRIDLAARWFAGLRERASIALTVLSGRWGGVVVAHSESWPLGRKLAMLARAPVFVDLHNVHSAWYRDAGDADLAAQYAALERDLLRRADVVAVCAPREAGKLPGPRASVVVMAHGIDESEWLTGPADPPRPVVRMFGTWDWEPNRAGLEWFLTEVWPRVLERHPGAECEIAGSHREWPAMPTGARAVGRVPSVPSFVSDAAALAVPVWGGVGAPLKYAEALVSGVPTIATNEAAHGLPATGGMVSDDPEEWARWLVAVLSDPQPWRHGAATLRDLVLASHTWYATSLPLREWAQSAAGRRELRPSWGRVRGTAPRRR